jgi:hypothetical protein
MYFAMEISRWWWVAGPPMKNYKLFYSPWRMFLWLVRPITLTSPFFRHVKQRI